MGKDEFDGRLISAVAKGLATAVFSIPPAEASAGVSAEILTGAGDRDELIDIFTRSKHRHEAAAV